MVRRPIEGRSDSWAGYAACGWAVAFGLAHVYAGLGGARVLIRHSVGETRASGDTFIAVGLFGTGLLCLVAGGLALALVQPWGLVVPRRMLLVAGWSVAAILFVHTAGAFAILALAGADVIELTTEPMRTYGRPRWSAGTSSSSSRLSSSAARCSHSRPEHS